MAEDQVTSTVFGHMIQRKRGKRALRPTASEIGISFSALARMENGSVIPKLRTLKKVCAWLGVDPAPFIGALVGAHKAGAMAHVQVIFPKRRSLAPKTSRALAAIILATHRQFVADITAEGHQ